MDKSKISDVMAAFVKNTKLEDIPKETVLFTKELALKTMAGMCAGSQLEGGVPLVKYAKSVGGHREAGVIGHGFKSSVLDREFDPCKWTFCTRC